MILGVGTDIVEISRITCASERFLSRVYTTEELVGLSQNAPRRTEQLAGMFAAKEAVVKALGCGFGRVTPLEVQILRAENGPPRVRLSGSARTLAEELGTDTIHISISHCKDYAVAYAVAEGR